MKVIVMGCGRMGEQVCRLLVTNGHDVTMIDSDARALDHIGSDLKVKKVVGIGFDRKVLIQSGIEHADAFAATSPSDNVNIISARIARNIFRVPRVIARLYDPRRAEIYRRLGLVTISMINWGAERIYEMLTHSDLDPVITFGKGEVILTNLELPFQLNGKTVRELTIPGELQVAAITRQGEAIMPILATELQPGDTLHLIVHSSSIDRLEALLGL